MSHDQIKGLDLKTDNAIHEICKTANESSSSTRSVLYILLLVSIISIISVLNSYVSEHASNWTTVRLKKNAADIAKILDQLPDTTSNKSYLDSIRPFFELETLKKRLENNLKNEMENVHSVRIPVLGNQFDINDLGLVGGLAIIILMFILRFTIMREASNLMIALKAITNRYPDNANEEDFSNYLKTETEKNKDAKKDLILAEINFIRRQHHYNFLSMNEIFNSPPLEVLAGDKKIKTPEKAIMNMFWFPLFIYLLIFVNDLSTIGGAWQMSKGNTVILLIAEILCTFIIFYYSYSCNKIRGVIGQLFINFKKANYKSA